MKRVGAGLSHHRDLRAGPLAVFSRVSIGEHVELADGVDSQQFAADASRRYRELARTRIFDTVQEKNVIRGTPAGHRERVPIAGTGARAFQAIIYCPRIERDQRVETASV